jgi:hypothetical protein
VDDERKIVPINDGVFHVPGIQREVVDLLNDLLEGAKRGEVIGIVVGAISPNHEIHTYSRKGSADYSQLVSAAVMCQFDLCHHWTNHEK